MARALQGQACSSEVEHGWGQWVEGAAPRGNTHPESDSLLVLILTFVPSNSGLHNKHGFFIPVYIFHTRFRGELALAEPHTELYI